MTGTMKREKVFFEYYGHMTDSSPQACASTLISRMLTDGVYVFTFSWSGHSGGAMAQCSRCVYAGGVTRWMGLIVAPEGNSWSLFKEGTDAVVVTKL